MKLILLVLIICAASLSATEPELTQRLTLLRSMLPAQNKGQWQDNRKDLAFFLVQEVFSHIAVGGVWSTTLTLINLGLETAEFPIRFWTTNGQPWTVVPTGINPGAAYTVTLGPVAFLDIELLSDGPTIRTGWAEIEQPSNSVIGGHAIFRDGGGPGRPIPFEAVVPLSTFAEGSDELDEQLRLSLMPFDQTRGFNTCLALANASSFSSVEVAVLGAGPDIPIDVSSGTTVVLGPRNQTAFCLRDTIPALEGKKGVLLIGRDESQLWLSILGLRFDPQGAFTTFFPMEALALP